jgi:type II secretory pathway pseudopilin PulG
MEERAQFTLRGLVVVTMLIAVVVALVVPSYVRAMRRFERGECRWNLRSLWQSQLNYSAQYGRMPEALGSEFFLAQQRTPRPVRNEVFFCPDTDDEIGPGRTSYRGPALPFDVLSFQDPVVADKEGNHGPGEGGNALNKSGDVGFCEPTDALWIRARTTTRE